jgi:hypothetical protein
VDETPRQALEAIPLLTLLLAEPSLAPSAGGLESYIFV